MRTRLSAQRQAGPGHARASDWRKREGSGSQFGPFHSTPQGPEPCLDRAPGSGRPSFSGRLGWPLRFAREEGVVASPPGHPPSSRLEVALVASSCSGGSLDLSLPSLLPAL